MDTTELQSGETVRFFTNSTDRLMFFSRQWVGDVNRFGRLDLTPTAGGIKNSLDRLMVIGSYVFLLIMMAG